MGWRVGLYVFRRVRSIFTTIRPPQTMKNKPMMVKASDRELESTNFPKIGDMIMKERLPVILAMDRAVALTSDSINRFMESNSNGKAKPRRNALKNIMGMRKKVLKNPNSIKVRAISKRRYKDAFCPIFVSIKWACRDPKALKSWKTAKMTPKYPILIPIES